MPISVLLAGDREFRAALAEALAGDYGLVEVDSVLAAADAPRASRACVAFVDMRGGSPVGVAICRRIRGAASTRLLPVVACADAGVDATVAALDSGADHVIGFPPPAAELKARVRAALRTRVATERLEDSSQVIFALANAVEAKDAYTEGHTERVGALAVEAGPAARVPDPTQQAPRPGGGLRRT